MEKGTWRVLRALPLARLPTGGLQAWPAHLDAEKDKDKLIYSAHDHKTEEKKRRNKIIHRKSIK